MRRNRGTGPERTEVLMVIAKEPVPGRVKTRLQSQFTPAQAAELAEAALHDTLDVVLRVRPSRAVLVLEGAAGSWLPEGYDVVRQRGAGLDQRLAAAFSDVMVPGQGPALLVGMDTPQLAPAHLAVDWRGFDAVLGLSPDGGFWALGLREPCAQALLGVPMSTPHTGAVLLQRLRRLGLRVALLPELLDVDTPADAAAVAALQPGNRFAATHRRLSGAMPPDDTEGPVHPMELFDAALSGARVQVVSRSGTRSLDVGRWSAAADEVDEVMLGRCEGTVLDLGCGPGRLVTALCERGVPALGVDISAAAVSSTARRGGSVLRRRVEDPLPGEGRWSTVLLADGNIGIGGDPSALLRRCVELLRPGGLLLVEADGSDGRDDREAVVLVGPDGRRSRAVPWARLGSRALVALAGAHQLGVTEEWRVQGRVLLALRSLAGRP